MKKNIITVSLLLSLFQVKAQEHFGKAIFTVPAGWQMTKTSETITLEKTTQRNHTCKIIISNSEQVAVTTSQEYLQYRTRNSGKGITYQNQRGSVTKYEADGLTGFFSRGTTTQKMLSVHSYFYSLSNGSQTFYYQLLTSNNDCINEFNQFMGTLKMELDEPEQGTARPRKTPPGGPCAPAPMM